MTAVSKPVRLLMPKNRVPSYNKGTMTWLKNTTSKGYQELEDAVPVMQLLKT